MNNGILDIEGKNPNPLNGEEYSDSYTAYSSIWSKLPAYTNAHEILNMIETNDVLIIRSDTGSGKTVLIPKFALHALDYKCGVIVSLPKKMIVKAAATYAALLLDVELGQEVGYKYKNTNVSSDKTKLLFVSDGVLSGYLIDGIKNKAEMKYGIIIIDEIHERKVQVDFNVFLLRILMNKYKNTKSNIKTIFMSADMSITEYEEYFRKFKVSSKSLTVAPKFSISTIMDQSIITTRSNKEAYISRGIDIITKRTTSKDTVLFFVPTIANTLEVARELKPVLQRNKDTRIVLSIYADSPDSIYLFMDDTNKIVIATNVAESSLTILGVTVVIDSGLEMYKYHDPYINCYEMMLRRISKAQIIQRMGRTGRTNNGSYYPIYAPTEITEAYPIPNICTENISEIILKSILVMNPDSCTRKSVIDMMSTEYLSRLEIKRIEAYVDHLITLKLIKATKGVSPYSYIVVKLPFTYEQSICLIAAYRHKKLMYILELFCLSMEIKNDIALLLSKDYVSITNEFKRGITSSNTDHVFLVGLIKAVKDKTLTDERINISVIRNSLRKAKAIYYYILKEIGDYCNSIELTKPSRVPKLEGILKTGLKFNTYKHNNDNKRRIANEVMRLASGKYAFNICTTPHKNIE